MSPSESPPAPTDRRVGAPLDEDVEHFEAECPVHGHGLHARHKAGTRSGRQRYNDRCLACHTAYNLAHPPAVATREAPESRPAAPTSKKAAMTANATAPGTVTARPISFAEIERLADSREPQDAYHLTQIGTLTPATVTVTSRPRNPEKKKGRNSRAYYAAIVDEKATEREGHTVYKPDVARGPVGEYVKVDIVDDFGLTRDGGMFTNAEAEEATALLELMRDPAATRRRLYVLDSRADEVPLTPVYGSMLTFSGVVADIDPDELAQRAEKALRAEFGPSLGRNIKLLTRPVEDRRVDVSDAFTGKTLALGILAAEAHFVPRTGNSVTVTDSDPDVIVG